MRNLLIGTGGWTRGLFPGQALARQWTLPQLVSAATGLRSQMLGSPRAAAAQDKGPPHLSICCSRAGTLCSPKFQEPVALRQPAHCPSLPLLHVGLVQTLEQKALTYHLHPGNGQIDVLQAGIHA